MVLCIDAPLAAFDSDSERSPCRERLLKLENRCNTSRMNKN